MSRVTDDMAAKSFGIITMTGSAVQGPTVPAKVVYLINPTGNDVVYVGTSAAITAGTGYPLYAEREAPPLAVGNLNQLYLIGTNGQTVRYLVQQ